MTKSFVKTNELFKLAFFLASIGSFFSAITYSIVDLFLFFGLFIKKSYVIFQLSTFLRKSHYYSLIPPLPEGGSCDAVKL